MEENPNQKSQAELVELKLAELRLLEEKDRLRSGLPFLHAWKWYPWARKFFESTNRMCLLTAGNQLSKSSTQIRKCIDWATNKDKWQVLWPKRRPRIFWYLYPSLEVAEIEFDKKWVPEFMPGDSYKDDPKYGWTFNRKKMQIDFNSGVTVYYKSYEQSVSNLQTATVDAIFCDEELPIDIYDELMFRTAASDGYFNMVFTATLGQEFWRLAMECQGTADEVLKDALKLQVSAYDCLEYDDGSPSPWTVERIQRMERTCKSHSEVQKRIYGRFVRDDGLKYPTYDSIVHRTEPTEIPENWLIYAGVDCGSGGETAHPAAICFIATNPEHTKARVFKAWRGDKIITTAADIMQKYLNMRAEIRRPVHRAWYDWASADFGTIATRIQEPFERANKSHELGEQTLNSLFKNHALTLDRGDIEIDKLSLELASMPQEGDKRKMKDDLIDACRYASSAIPFDWFAITGGKEAQAKALPTGGVDLLMRDKKITPEDLPGYVDPASIEAEIDEWNGYYN